MHTEAALLGAMNLQLFGDVDATGAPVGKFWTFCRPQDWENVKLMLEAEFDDPTLGFPCRAWHTHKT